MNHLLASGTNLSLLRAAFAKEPSDVLRGWMEWRADNTLDACQYRLHRVLPLVFRRLEREPVDPADLNILRGIYRYNWTRNQVIARCASCIIAALQEAGVAVIVLKGLAVAHLTYRDGGTRPMQDFDLLVSPSQRATAIEVLEKNGWKASYGVPHIRSQHGCEFMDAQEHRLDLHWYATEEGRWKGVDDGFWRRSRPLSLQQGVDTRALSATDCLLHVCIHGMKDSANSMGWIADACSLIQGTAPIDWNLLIEETRERRIVPSMLVAFEFIHRAQLAEIPDFVLRKLEGAPVSLFDRLYFLSKVKGGHGWSFWLRPFLDFHRHERPTFPSGIIGFLSFLRRRWGLERFREIPRQAWERFQGLRARYQN